MDSKSGPFPDFLPISDRFHFLLHLDTSFYIFLTPFLFFFVWPCHDSKIQELEEELKVVSNNVKSLEVNEEKVNTNHWLIDWLIDFD